MKCKSMPCLLLNNLCLLIKNVTETMLNTVGGKKKHYQDLNAFYRFNNEALIVLTTVTKALFPKILDFC